MKKPFCFLLAAATVLTLCACSGPEDPVDTVPSTTPSTTLSTSPSTAPSLPEPSEPMPTEPSEPPVTLPQPDEDPVICQHQYSQTVVNPTCQASGSITQTCIHCADVQVKFLPTLGHDYLDGLCSRCGETDPSVPVEVTYTVTVRSDKGKTIPDVIVSVYTGGDEPAATGITNEKGVATMTLLPAESYTVKLSVIPPGFSCKESYTTTSTRVNINLTTLSYIDPEDHSKANYKVGSTMGDFTLKDTDGNSYTLSKLLQEKKLVILNFWFVNCGPCKAEFPYFEAVHEKYSQDVQLLTLNHLDDIEDIVALRDEMGVTFPMIAENIGFQQGFGIFAYPTTVFIAPSGKILKIQVGEFKTQAQLESLIDSLI